MLSLETVPALSLKVAGKVLFHHYYISNYTLLYLRLTVNLSKGAKTVYKIYFDESGKLDDKKMYSYYGAAGGSLDAWTSLDHRLASTLPSTPSHELHFSQLKDDKYMHLYIHALNEFLQEEDLQFNAMIINNSEAKVSSETMNLSKEELRKLFYVKIPERLYYGMTRGIEAEHAEEVEVYMDQNNEYQWLYGKIKDQMQAHALYRKKAYTIHTLEPLDSYYSYPLQITDIILGLVSFLMEQSFLPTKPSEKLTTTKQIQSEMVFRFLSQNRNLEKFLSKITLYKWEGTDELLQSISLSTYISRFMIEKQKNDLSEILKVQQLISQYPEIETRHVRKHLSYSNSQARTIRGYIEQASGRPRF
ncbi:uncharacterized protein DUF3800 [Salsuginibacillus halophilus]|uniref:Uncharacterized protein DUF3800 n=1 Tax=Salsuginibacillus halophilus TaxID=517424 RepID=A0A2P8HQR6_9BACI|nr:DUF3800 domain-containing protein [Salsuginibacillus halophilus]PSL48563.1 uncharacterized protein DUF3800 [Salsuginibacillus halophilus]